VCDNRILCPQPIAHCIDKAETILTCDPECKLVIASEQVLVESEAAHAKPNGYGQWSVNCEVLVLWEVDAVRRSLELSRSTPETLRRCGTKNPAVMPTGAEIAQGSV
jgi:hypothetical protein